MTVNKSEHLCCDARNCNYTVTIRCFFGRTRESLQLWFLSVQTSLSFKLRFVQHGFHQSKHHLHFVPRQTRKLYSSLVDFGGMSFCFMLMSVSFPPRLACKGSRISVDEITTLSLDGSGVLNFCD